MSIRPVQASPIKGSNGKWASRFEMFRAAADGTEYVVSQVETAAVWFDAQAATLAGTRAVQEVNQTGKFPNMCEIW